ARTRTGPAPLYMCGTVVTLRPESEWRKGMTWERLNDEMDRTIRFPGMPNIFWMPIMTRTEMLATGFRTPVGVKVLGPDLTEIGRIGRDIEGVLSTVPGTRSAFAERTTGGYYLDLRVRRDAVATAPPSIHDEQGALAGYVSVDVAGRDLGTYVAEAKRALAERVSLPPGYRLGWAGQFEYLERARGRLALLVPLTLLIVFVLLHLNTASVTKTMLILLAVPS